MFYIILGKQKGKKQFKGFNLANGDLVNQKDATVIPDDKLHYWIDRMEREHMFENIMVSYKEVPKPKSFNDLRVAEQIAEMFKESTEIVDCKEWGAYYNKYQCWYLGFRDRFGFFPISNDLGSPLYEIGKDRELLKPYMSYVTKRICMLMNFAMGKTNEELEEYLDKLKARL